IRFIVGDIPDAWVWHYTPTGLYTVSSGYRLSQASRVPIPSTIGPMLVDSHLWAKVWSSPIQPKLKIFIWKFFHNILPLREALARHSIDVILNCPVCGQDVGTVHHLFQRCVVAQQLGNLMGCQSFLLDHHPVALWRRLYDENPSQAYKLIYFWWRLWKGRSGVRAISNYDSMLGATLCASLGGSRTSPSSGGSPLGSLFPGSATVRPRQSGLDFFGRCCSACSSAHMVRIWGFGYGPALS
ncbi:hypothetical protein LINGRAHAP2_LOCUS15440, partial [Linum grandiflorum]